MADDAITVTGLRKSYGDIEAVAGVDLSVRTGEVFALLGPNGAGKTTIVEILEGYRQPTGGQVTVLGHDPSRRERGLRERVGIVLQSTGIDPFLTVRETIEMYGAYYPSRRPTDEVIEVVGLVEKRDTRVNKLSGGQQRRLDLAIALAGDPELLFMDEPTTGFDPGARRNAWEVLKNLATLGKTVFLTTHYMDEAQVLSDRVAVISKGEIVALGPPDTIGDRHLAETVIRFRVPPEPVAVPLEAAQDGDMVEIRTHDPTTALHELTEWALTRSMNLEGLSVTRPSLEDVYLELTGQEAGTS